MTYPAPVLVAIERLRAFFIGGIWVPASGNVPGNPGGFDGDGHAINFVPALRDVALVGHPSSFIPAASCGRFCVRTGAHPHMATETVSIDLNKSWTLISSAIGGPLKAKSLGPFEVQFYIGPDQPGSNTGSQRVTSVLTIPAVTEKVWARSARNPSVTLEVTRVVDATNPVLPAVGAVTLSAQSFAVGAVPGTEIGAFNGLAPGDVIDGFAPQDGRVVLSADRTKLLVGLSTAAAGDFKIRVRVSNPKAVPIRKTVELTLTCGAGGGGTLGPLTAAFTAGAASGSLVAAITGLGPSETIALVTPNDGRLALDGTRRNLIVGLSAATAGTIATTLTTSAGRTLAMTLTVNAGGGFVGDPDRYMFALTRARMPGGAVTASAANDTYRASAFKFSNAQYRQNSLRFHYSGFASTQGGNAPQETVLTNNDVIIDEVWAQIGTTFQQLFFGGQPGVTIVSNTLGAWTDDLNIPGGLAPEADVTIWTIYHVTTAGHNFLPTYLPQLHRGERIYGGASLAAVKANMVANPPDSTPALVTTYSAQGQPFHYGPDINIAKGWDGRPVALCLHDSIGYGRNEYSGSADARGNMGWISRYLDNPGGLGRVPHLLLGHPGGNSARELNTDATKRHQVVSQVRAFNPNNAWPMTVIFNANGFNDRNNDPAAWLSTVRGFVTGRLKPYYPGMRLVQATIMGRNTVANRGAALEDMTYDTQNGPTVLGVVNDDIRNTRLSGNVDAVIDLQEAWGAPEDRFKWKPFRSMSPVASLVQDVGSPALDASWTTVVTDKELKPYNAYAFDFNGSAGTGIGLVRIISSIRNPDGTWTSTRDVSSTSNIYAGSKFYNALTDDSTHPLPGRHQEMADAIPQAHKLRLAA